MADGRLKDPHGLEFELLLLRPLCHCGDFVDDHSIWSHDHEPGAISDEPDEPGPHEEDCPGEDGWDGWKSRNLGGE